MINILHAVTIMNRGGQESLIMNMYRNIDRREFNFSFLCSSAYKDVKGDFDDEIHRMGGNIYYPPYLKLSEMKFLRRIGEMISSYRFFKAHPEFDILHIHTHHSFYTLGELIGARLAGVPHIVIHSHNTSSSKKWLHFLFRPVLNAFYIERFACSKDAGYWLFGKKGVEAMVVNNGIEAGKYIYSQAKRDNLRESLGLTNSDFVIGHIGRFNFQKNHTFLIDIFKEIYKIDNNSRLVLVGKGELENDIREKVHISGLEDRVMFLGVREDIPDLLSCFDVFLFPSLFEGLSVVLIEAQASGIPCVVSDTNSRDAVITECVDMIPLSSSAKEWAQQVISHKGEPRRNTLDEIRSAGYDIIQTVKQVGDKYKEIAQKKLI